LHPNSNHKPFLGGYIISWMTSKSEDNHVHPTHSGLPLSIILPVYNVEEYIRPCMESIFQQGLDDTVFELIIVNDGSTDKSMEMIADIIDQHHNITVINQQNQGLSMARNNGMAKAKGEYLLMPDSDDLLVQHSVPYLLKKALTSKADLVVADYLMMKCDEMEHFTLDSVIQKDGTTVEKTGEQLFMQDLDPRHCYMWRTLFRRAFLEEQHIRFVPNICAQDVPFTHECYLKAGKCLRVSWLLNVYRRNRTGAATASYSLKKGKDFSVAIAKTWELTKMDLPAAVKSKLSDNVYTSFCVNLWKVSLMESAAERRQVMDFLKEQVPDLSFHNGIKQRVYSFLYHYMPYMLINMRMVYGMLVKNR